MAAWFGRMGKAVVDGGNPFTGAAKTVTSSGVTDGPIDELPTGYNATSATRGLSSTTAFPQAAQSAFIGASAGGSKAQRCSLIRRIRSVT